MAKVTIDNVSKTYPGDIRAVNKVSLDIKDGEFVVLVGPSGCGKSTTLRMIAGLEEVTKGTISIGDRIVNDVHPKNRDIAMVFQNYALYPHMTVYKNMAFGLKLRKVPKHEIQERVQKAADILGINELLERKPRSLSGGQRQRVAVGRAIVRDPACFLFDEPLSNLDVKLRVQMRAEIKALHMRLKTTTIYVTHDQEEAMTLGDRIAVMSQGKIQQVGAPIDVYRKPANRFVAGFVGLPPMNFIEGRIERIDGQLTFVDDGNIKISVPADIENHVLHALNRNVVIGIRPEVIDLTTSNTSDNTGFSANIRVVEPLGDRQDVFLKTKAGTELVARIDAGVECKPDDTIQITPRSGAVHFFDTGEFGKHMIFGMQSPID